MPTQDNRISETQWFTDPSHPLIENKVFYAKVDDLLFYITAHRGPSTDDLQPSRDEVTTVLLNDKKGFEDTSGDCFNKLIKYLDTPVQ